MRRTLLLVAFSVVAAHTRAARANDVALTWSVDVEPTACDGRRFAREVELACDAMGRACAVVDESADRRATLHCDPSAAWMLDVRDETGTLRWTIAVEGEDRMRRAAIWVARTHRDAPPADARLVAVAASAPPPEPEAAETAPAPSPPPVLLVTLPQPYIDRAAPAPLPAVSSAPGGLTFAARTLVGSGFGVTLGARGAIAVAVPSSRFAVAFSLTGERALSAPFGYTYSVGRLGAGIGYGAPFGREPFGVALEAGAMLGDVAAPAATLPSSKEFVHPYAQLSLLAQWNASRTLRPFAGLSLVAHSLPVHVSGAGMDVATIPWIAAALDVGVAWRSW